MKHGLVGRMMWWSLTLGAVACTKAPPEQKAPEPPPAAEQKAPEPKENPSMAAATLECALSVPPTGRAGEPVQVQFRLTNRTDKPLSVLRWRSPLEGRPLGDDFTVTREGTAIPYQGPMAKRGNPGADSYVAIAPGATAEGRIELSLVYEMKQPGRYRIEFRGPLLDVVEAQAEVPHTLDQFKPQPVSCPAVETTLTAP